MTDTDRNGCLREIDRLSNEQLSALISGVVIDGKGASAPLFAAVAPLLIAFYEGQVQAGRARHEHLEALVQDAFLAIYQRCASYDPAHPIRAWLIEIARCTLVDYLQKPFAEASITPLAGSLPDTRRAAVRAV